MRLFLSIPLAVAAIATLGACGQSEEALKSSFRTGALAGCQRGDPSARAQMERAGINVDQYCTCAIDRYLQTATMEQIRRDSENPNNSTALRSAAMQCAGDMMRQSNTAAGAPSLGAGAAPTAPAPAEDSNADANAATE